MTQLYGVRERHPAEGVDRDPDKGKGPVSNTGPHQNPSQGDNPNVALTRPHIIGPLTLVGR